MSDLASFIVEIVLFTPFSLPYYILESGPTPPCGWTFAMPPYAADAKGYLEPARCLQALPSERSAAPERAPQQRAVALQGGVESLASLDGSYWRVQGRVRLLTSFRFELDLAYADYFGDQAGWLGQSHAAVRFAQSERIQFRAGAGLRDRFTPNGAAAGFDVLYAVDVFWLRHIATTLELTGGSLGHGWCAEVRSTAGYIAGPIEAYGGWDGVWLGAPRESTAYLGGPVVGLRAYF